MDENKYQKKTYYTGKKIEIPMKESDSFIEPERQTKFDLNDYCITNPHGTYFIEVHGRRN